MWYITLCNWFVLEGILAQFQLFKILSMHVGGRRGHIYTPMTLCKLMAFLQTSSAGMPQLNNYLFQRDSNAAH